ncbi:MAG: hypothetical protein ACI8W8_004931 [Rhodothermales bacterium]
MPFAWLMRDGLGPDSISSSGVEAISRCFMTFYAGPIVIALILLSAACHYSGRREQPENREP